GDQRSEAYTGGTWAARLSLERASSREPTLSGLRKATPLSQNPGSGSEVPAGSESGARVQGLPRNLGDLLVFFDYHRVWRSGDPGQAEWEPRKAVGAPIRSERYPRRRNQRYKGNRG